MKIQNVQFQSIEQVTNQYLNQQLKSSGTQVQSEEISFQKILEQKQSTSELKFSKHASERLNSRNIQITQEQMQRLESGTKKAEEKGINESLVLVDQMAFIVNVKNQTVITAMDQNEANEKVFTNIDGAVIV